MIHKVVIAFLVLILAANLCLWLWTHQPRSQGLWMDVWTWEFMPDRYLCVISSDGWLRCAAMWYPLYVGPERDFWPRDMRWHDRDYLLFGPAARHEHALPPGFVMPPANAAPITVGPVRCSRLPSASPLRGGIGIAVQQWFLSLSLLAYPTLSIVVWAARRQRRQQKNLCIKCGYSLTGNVSGICPECGLPCRARQQAE